MSSIASTPVSRRPLLTQHPSARAPAPVHFSPLSARAPVPARFLPLNARAQHPRTISSFGFHPPLTFHPASSPAPVCFPPYVSPPSVPRFNAITPCSPSVQRRAQRAPHFNARLVLVLSTHLWRFPKASVSYIPQRSCKHSVPFPASHSIRPTSTCTTSFSVSFHPMIHSIG